MLKETCIVHSSFKTQNHAKVHIFGDSNLGDKTFKSIKGILLAKFWIVDTFVG